MDELLDRIFSSDWFPWAAGLFAVAFLVLCGYAALQDEKEWEAYRVEHHCVLVATVAPTTAISNGIDANGNATFGTIYVPGRSTFMCDGLQVTR